MCITVHLLARFCGSEGSNKKPRYLQDSPLLRQDNCSARTLLSSSYPHSVTLAARRSLLFGFVTRDIIHQPCGFCQPLSLKSFNLFFTSLFSVAVVAGSLARRQFVVYQNRAPFVKGLRKLFLICFLRVLRRLAFQRGNEE